MTHDMSELLRAAAGKGTAPTPEPDPDTPEWGSADGGRQGEPVRLTPSMNDALRVAADVAKGRRHEW